MAWRPDRLVQAGELDNTRLGWTIGWLELTGFPERLRLKLAGNCYPDLAGWKFRIKRAMPELAEDLASEESNYYSDGERRTEFIGSALHVNERLGIALGR